MEKTTYEFQQALENYVHELQEKHNEHPRYQSLNNSSYAKNGQYNNFSFDKGRKFVAIWNTKGQKGIHCFVEIATGNILKAATWRAPAKGARGNIYNVEKPIFAEDFYVR